MTQYYSRSDTAYSGSAIFSIPFSYIKKDNIKVKIIREVLEEETEIDATFTWLNDTQITVTSELQEGDIVSIRRNTPINQKIVTYQNQSMILDENNLNLSQDQLLNVVQEMYDNNVTFEIQVDGDIGDIATKVNTAINKADSAISTANSADSKADTALSTANTASTNASSAVTTANNAASTANTANTNANNAVSTANSADSKATDAKNKVDTLETDIQAVISAAEKINELEEAVTTATNAATTATNKATEATNAANRAEAVIPTQTGQNGKFLQTNGSSTQWAEVDLTTKQDTLVSGTNIKTINNNSILGSGNLTLDGLPSQTGNADKFLKTNGTTASWAEVQGGSSRNIGEIVFSTTPQTDAGLHLLDGGVIQGGGSYDDFVDYIADLYDSGDYTDIFETEANWQAAVTQYGVCGKFVYDDVNNTVRLPKYSNKIYTSDFENNAPVVGTGMVLGLTNGTGTAGFAAGTYAVTDPTAYGEDASTTGASNTRLQGLIGVTTDGTKSGLIAQLTNITTSLEGYYYIVIATSTKTEIEVDIDEIATDLNGKVDKANLVNIVEAFSLMIPDYSAGISFSIANNSSATYTAPSIGFITLDVWCVGTTAGTVTVNGNSVIIASSSGSSAYARACAQFYVDEGDVIVATNANIITKGTFYPLKGDIQ